MQPIFAQKTVKKPDQAAKKEITQLTKDLNLSDKQSSSIHKKLAVYYAKKEELVQSSKTPDKKKQAMRNLNQKKIMDMRDLLNDKQYNKFVQMKLSADTDNEK